MPNPYHYRSVVNRLVRLSEATNPAHVRLKAVIALIRELSPSNPNRAINDQMLRSVDGSEFARHQLRDLYDRAHPLDQGPTAEPTLTTEEEAPDEDDDPL